MLYWYRFAYQIELSLENGLQHMYGRYMHILRYYTNASVIKVPLR